MVGIITVSSRVTFNIAGKVKSRIYVMVKTAFKTLHFMLKTPIQEASCATATSCKVKEFVASIILRY